MDMYVGYDMSHPNTQVTLRASAGQGSLHVAETIDQVLPALHLLQTSGTCCAVICALLLLCTRRLTGAIIVQHLSRITVPISRVALTLPVKHHASRQCLQERAGLL